MSVEFCYVDLSTNRTVEFAVQDVQMQFIKCPTTDPLLLWFGARSQKKKNLALLHLN